MKDDDDVDDDDYDDEGDQQRGGLVGFGGAQADSGGGRWMQVLAARLRLQLGDSAVYLRHRV